MAAATSTPTISVLLVDDNFDLAKTLSGRLTQEGFHWRGHLGRADFLRVHVEAACPDVRVVLLDLDMPGKDPLTVVAELTAHCPSVRTIIFTAYYTKELVQAALRAGACGYVCKIDGTESLIEGINAVMDDEVYLSPEARTVHELD
jgi:DNA-binding NarL/FixJ family response regulator